MKFAVLSALGVAAVSAASECEITYAQFTDTECKDAGAGEESVKYTGACQPFNAEKAVLHWDLAKF